VSPLSQGANSCGCGATSARAIFFISAKVYKGVDFPAENVGFSSKISDFPGEILGIKRSFQGKMMEHWALRTDETLIPNNRPIRFLGVLMGIVWEEYGNGGPSLGV